MSSVAPHAFVKFQCDNIKSIVPCAFIKHYDPKKDVEGTRAHVFWSPIDGETPIDVEREQGIVKDIDKLIETKKRGQKLTLPGYYNAEILKVAETEEELSNLIDNKRIKTSTVKALDAKEQSVKAGSSREKPSRGQTNNTPAEYVSKAKVLNMIKDGQSLTLDKVRKKFDPSGSPTKEALQEKIKTLETELSANRKKLKRKSQEISDSLEDTKKLKDENKTLMAEVTMLRSMNYKYQEKLFFGRESVKVNLFQDQVTDDGKNASRKAAAAVSKTPLKVTLSPASSTASPPSKKFPEAIIASPSSLSVWTVSPSKKQNTTPKKTPKKIESPGKEQNTTPKKTPKKIESPGKEQNTTPKKTSQARPLLNLSPAKLKKCLVGVREKERGDSVYIKNLATAIFGIPMLINSSYSGRKFSRDKTGKARPSLPEAGKEYLKELFTERMLSERPLPSSSDQERRSDDQIFRRAIADKIKDLRKPPKAFV